MRGPDSVGGIRRREDERRRRAYGDLEEEDVGVAVPGVGEDDVGPVDVVEALVERLGVDGYIARG